eukprot:GHVL01011819.1.p1 GENE.GHVL01011819.1~~GHVL01011819.1.p1  ORF type:complete len:275 (-),score=66.74 GHVL01011819.1:43-867(-)
MTSRLLASIDKKIDEKSYYDALLMIKTVSDRESKNIENCQSILIKYAKIFSEKKIYSNVVDIGERLVSIWKKLNISVSDDLVIIISDLISLIPPDCACEKYDLLHNVLSWSKSEWPSGHVVLHRTAADSLLAEKDYGGCQVHLVYCSDGEGLADMIKIWQEEGYPSEKHLYALRAVLMLLCIPDIETAETFLKQMNDEKIPPPPIQLSYFLIEAQKDNNYDLFLFLKKKYFLIIRRDPEFEKYLEYLSQNIYGAAPVKQQGLMSMLDSLMNRKE